MEKFKIWLRKNWSTTLLFTAFVVLLVSPDAKAWLMRQIISTGLLNSKIEDKPAEQPATENIANVSENFSVQDENGKIINTSELKGKVVFISGHRGVHRVGQNFLQFRNFMLSTIQIKIWFSSL